MMSNPRRWQEVEQLAEAQGYKVNVEEGIIDVTPASSNTTGAASFRFDEAGM